MIQELDTVVLKKDLAESGLTAGDVGTVVMVHGNGQGFEVEFLTLDGATLAVASLNAGDVREVDHHEVAHARSLAA
jgi:hypothetical protein